MIRKGSRHHSSIERVSVKNAMNPVLWVCAIISVPNSVTISLAPNPSWVNMVLAAAPVGVSLFSFLYFMFRDPDRLQSENFQLKRHALELIEEKGSPSIIDAATIAVISNPDLPALPAPESEVER